MSLVDRIRNILIDWCYAAAFKLERSSPEAEESRLFDLADCLARASLESSQQEDGGGDNILIDEGDPRVQRDVLQKAVHMLFPPGWRYVMYAEISDPLTEITFSTVIFQGHGSSAIGMCELLRDEITSIHYSNTG